MSFSHKLAVFVLLAGLNGCAFVNSIPPNGNGKSFPALLVGRWSGEKAESNGVVRAWVQERRANGAYEIRFTLTESSGHAVETVERGNWWVRAGFYEEVRDREGAKPDTYHFESTGGACLSFVSTGPDASASKAPVYTFSECKDTASRYIASQECVAEFDSEALGKEIPTFTIRLETISTGGVKAYINNELTNDQVEVNDYPIRPGFDAPDKDPAQANPGESSLLHAKAMSSAEPKVTIPFVLEAVAKVRIYDLLPGSASNEFGGTVLFEAFDARGRSLGMIFRSLMISVCVPAASASGNR